MPVSSASSASRSGTTSRGIKVAHPAPNTANTSRAIVESTLAGVHMADALVGRMFDIFAFKASGEPYSERRAHRFKELGLLGRDRRQFDDLDQTAAGAVSDPDVTTRPANDFAGDREAKAGSRNTLRARWVDAEEGFEHLV